jgi:hypothetical protein
MVLRGELVERPERRVLALLVDLLRRNAIQYLDLWCYRDACGSVSSRGAFWGRAGNLCGAQSTLSRHGTKGMIYILRES